jgi:hypothetical protein
MKNSAYNFELADLLRSFISALDGCVINRYHDQNRQIADRIEVAYVYAPKQKVLEDLVNKGANIKIPIVAITMTSLKRDTKRVFNKIQEMYFSQGVGDSDIHSASDHFRMPIPINISLSISILTKFQKDMDQILSNFIVNCNPYFVISWKVPEGFLSNVTEIRSKVRWDESVLLTTPINNINAETKSHITADTTFEIEGWLFTAVPTTTVENIYFITEHLIPVTYITDDISLVPTTSGLYIPSASADLIFTSDNVEFLANSNFTTVSALTATSLSLVQPLTAIQTLEVTQ